MTPKELIRLLNQLTTTCCESRDGYTRAGETVSSVGLRVVFDEYAEQRAQFARELCDLVLNMGGMPAKKGNPLGETQRAWSVIRQTRSSEDHKAILNACGCGERAALDAYRDALSRTLPPHIAVMLEEHSTQIAVALDRVSELREDPNQQTHMPPQPKLQPYCSL